MISRFLSVSHFFKPRPSKDDHEQFFVEIQMSCNSSYWNGGDQFVSFTFPYGRCNEDTGSSGSATRNRKWDICSCRNSAPQWEAMTADIETGFALRAHLELRFDSETAMWQRKTIKSLCI
ncbi:hypothetical protein L1987_46462 [Smallanthus sonchifolius]|uniref:Uncharacterized protein n=1 Tax=Smallanthus sonchifolius TaxID=185202 RepID=A0ACB9FZV5_9ASTR|nr:hypothetical protein L1987_46462 [Smallanthus sonchifolius]